MFEIGFLVRDARLCRLRRDISLFVLIPASELILDCDVSKVIQEPSDMDWTSLTSPWQAVPPGTERELMVFALGG